MKSVEKSLSERKRGGASRKDARAFKKKQAKYTSATSEHAVNMDKARQAISELRSLAGKDLRVARQIVDEARRHQGGHAT